LVLFAACVPFNANAPFQTSPDRAFACASDTLQSLGYMIIDADERAGTIKADRPLHAPHPFGPHLFGGFGPVSTDEHDVIRVAISEERSTHQPTIYVTGDTMLMQEGGIRAGGVIGRRRTPAVENDSKRVLERCGL
jgi:hypothetical protein